MPNYRWYVWHHQRCPWPLIHSQMLIFGQWTDTITDMETWPHNEIHVLISVFMERWYWLWKFLVLSLPSILCQILIFIRLHYSNCGQPPWLGLLAPTNFTIMCFVQNSDETWPGYVLASGCVMAKRFSGFLLGFPSWRVRPVAKFVALYNGVV